MPRKSGDSPNKDPKSKPRKPASQRNPASSGESPSPASKSKPAGQRRTSRVSPTERKSTRASSGSSASTASTGAPPPATAGPDNTIGVLSSPELYERIAARAYELYERRGCTHGSDLEDWLQAERDVLGSSR